MSETTLTVKDFADILTFQRSVRPESGHYPANAVRLFRELFGWNLTAYSKWSKSQNVNILYTNALDEDFVRESHELLLRDQVFQTYNEQIQSNTWSGIFFSQDAFLPGPEESDLLRLLNAHNIHYFVTMVINQDPKEHYVFYKTQKEGPFTLREKEILHYLQQILSTCASAATVMDRQSDALRVLCQQMDREGKGIAVIDENRTVLAHNESIFHTTPKGQANASAKAVLRNLIETLEKQSGIPFGDWREKLQAETGSFLVTAEEISLQSSDRSRSSFFLLIATPVYYRDFQVHYSLSKDYHLTEREAQIAELLIKGLPNKAIADSLYLSLSTVKVHISHIYRKLQVHNRMGVVEKLVNTKKGSQ